MVITDFQPVQAASSGGTEQETAAETSGEEEDEEEEEEESGDDETESDEDAPKVRVPRHRSEEEEEDATPDNNALKAAMQGVQQATGRPANGGIGVRTMGGIGSKARSDAISQAADPAPVASTSASPAPASPGTGQSALEQPKSGMGMAAAQQRRAFLGASTPAGQAAPRKPAVLSKDEQKHFTKLASQGGFGFNLLKKMGWSAGAGLGAGGEGMVTPLESKLRPKAMGLAFEGFTERTKQSKLEEKRKKAATGEAVSDDDEDALGRPKRKGKDKQKTRPAKQGEAEGPPAWKQKKPRKPKVQHMSYEEMVAGGSAAASPAGVGAIYDLSGRELTTADLSHAASSHDVPSTDSRNLPELLHNLTMVSDFTKAEVDNLVREARISAERRKYLAKEAAHVRASAKANLERRSQHVCADSVTPTDFTLAHTGIARLQQLTKVATAIQQHSTSLAYDDRPLQEQMQTFSDLFSQLLNVATEDEYQQYRLDEVIVAALAPLLKRAWQEWDVLSEPTLYLAELKKWKKAFRCRQRRSDTSNAVGLFGSYSSAKPTSPLMTPMNDPKMTAFEVLLWTMWMPRVRSAINNTWQPSDPTPILALYSSWQSSGLLPDFISDNLLDQLVLPKLKRAVSDWIPPRKGKRKSSNTTALHHILFPWLEYAGPRMDEVMDDAKRKVRGWLKTCKIREGPPEGLEVWREVIQSSEWDNLILQYIVPQLASQLREDFIVNPREQDLKPLNPFLAWKNLLRDSVLSQILETEFFPKFLDTLHTWLSASGVNFEQVAEWYSWWKKEVFGSLSNLPGVARGFETALDLMNQAVSLGEDAKYRLQKPNFSANAPSSTTSRTGQSGKAAQSTKQQARIPAMDPNEVTFRAVVEEYAAENNLVFMPTGRSHEMTGSPLFRVSPGVDGKGGITIYLRGDVVYAVDKNGNSKPISVSEMVEQAKKKT